MENVKLDKVEFHWPKLVTPVAPFGEDIYEVQIQTADKEQAKQWKDVGLNVKPTDEGRFFVNLKRKARTSKGIDMGPPKIVNGELEAIDGNTIGNGSIGNIILDRYEYTSGGRKGTSFGIKAIQVVKHVQFGGAQALDFDMFETEIISGTDDKHQKDQKSVIDDSADLWD